MIIHFNIDYWTNGGENIFVCGSLPELGEWDEEKALPLNFEQPSNWSAQLTLKESQPFDYYYIVKREERIERREWGKHHQTLNSEIDILYLSDLWHDKPQQDFLYSSVFQDSFFYHKIRKPSTISQSIILNVSCPFVEKDQELILCGVSDLLGNWNPANAPRFLFSGNGQWQLIINAAVFHYPLEYKLAIYDKKAEQIIYWENGEENRTLYPLSETSDIKITQSIDMIFWHNPVHWKAAGVTIPVFSLRSNDSFGTGEFSDLKKMVDWAAATGQKIIQVLPINDTTITHTWQDSYPYSAISIYALHPLYLGLKEFPLKNKKLFRKYLNDAKKLNTLNELDYQNVMFLKQSYFNDLFNEKGEETLHSNSFKKFFRTNKEWLFPYACFSFLRDKFGTADYSKWNKFSEYNKKDLETLISADPTTKRSIELAYFIQYLLHTQLSEVKEYAHQKGVVLKGDIPIGINRYSVEAWVEPHLFNLDTQTGAPPDDFSATGQNWGFPTYNWDEIAKEGYSWWIKRFKKMSDYFDAYRIDHILGFFRIWEIPRHSVQGLLGCFNPAIPFSTDEITITGFPFDEEKMTTPYIHDNYIHQIFGEHTQEVIDNYLTSTDNQQFQLKSFCDTQLKIKGIFEGKEDEKDQLIREGLYSLCNEVLFIRDKKETDKFHPRISAQTSYVYKQLDESSKTTFNHLYDNFYYYRHNEFWKEQAMKKLPVLISSTQMLVCGEDLGMIPQSVPEVMNELQILSLEIQRMPKQFGMLFSDLTSIPYLSVCTTSTHDMSPIRTWWKENRVLTQKYYNDILHNDGEAPEECSPQICRQIVEKHLSSSAMLVILPLQDWLSVDIALRRKNPEEERINIPANPNHYWKYRMHLMLEQLSDAREMNEYISSQIQNHNR